jgi:endonuclease/exonuclease/phosphatase family metal-dependent hydrolase
MRPTSIVATVAAAALLSACGPVRMQFEPVLESCRRAEPAGGPAVRWIGPSDAGDRKALGRWCDAVGPVAGSAEQAIAAPQKPAVVVVSWNMAVGKGDLAGLIEEVRGGHPGAELILLLQEAYRAKAAPGDCPTSSRRARAIGLPRPQGSEDIVEFARRTRMQYVYAPSMRNGIDCAAEPREDRGNAILSTLPLSEVAVVELPFAKQRRVALAARVRHGDRSFLVLSTHFDTTRGHKRMARGIAQTIDLLEWTGPLVIGGDFNSALLGRSGMREMRKHFAELDCGSGSTHALGRLDHVFVGAHDQLLACRTGQDRHDSDHKPLIAVIPAK